MSSQSSNTESLSRFPLWQVITPVRRKVILAMALAGLAALTSLGALLFLAWSLRDIRATPDAILAWPLGGVIGCVVLTLFCAYRRSTPLITRLFIWRTFCAAG